MKENEVRSVDKFLCSLEKRKGGLQGETLQVFSGLPGLGVCYISRPSCSFHKITSPRVGSKATQLSFLRNSIICALFCSHQANCQLPTWLSSEYPTPTPQPPATSKDPFHSEMSLVLGSSDTLHVNS